MIQLINIVKKVCFSRKLKKILFWTFFLIFKHSRQKAEGSYQSSVLDLNCRVLVLNDVHVLI